MATVIGDICFPMGKFTDRGGNEKTRWGKAGVLMRRDDGSFCGKIDMIPVGAQDDLWFSVFEKKNPTHGSSEKPAQDRSESVDPDEDLPF